MMGSRSSLCKGPEAVVAGTAAGQCNGVWLSRGKRALFRAGKLSHFIAGSNSASWSPSESTVLVPFFTVLPESRKESEEWQSGFRKQIRNEAKIPCVG